MTTKPTTLPTTSQHTLHISCADGLENSLLTELALLEITQFKPPTQIGAGRIALTTDVAGLYRICLYSRVASRVLLPLSEYGFMRADDNTIKGDVANLMYDFASTIDWTALFGIDNSFVVKTHVDKRVAVNQQFATLRIKDAIVDSFYQRYNARPNVDSRQPDFVIHVHIGLDKASIALDLSGTSLHRRGYRVVNTDAPLKENLAAALLYQSGWQTFSQPNNLNNHQNSDVVLLDPMCGSGTFIIEALLMYFDYPVGIDKSGQHFGFYHWQYHDEPLWQQMCQSALSQFHENLNNKPLPKVIACDGYWGAINAFKKNIKASALISICDDIQIYHQQLSELGNILKSLNNHDRLFFISNPPYGERLGQEHLLKPLYQHLALTLNAYAPKNTQVAILAGKVEQLDLLPMDNSHTLKCHNGALVVYFRHGKLYQSLPNELIHTITKTAVAIDNDDNLDEFINRLQKNISHLKKQAKKERVSNLRIYDADLPNFNVAIDIYGDKVHIQEYAPPKQIDEAVAKRRFSLVLLAIRQLLNINKQDIFIKTRFRQSGNEQYSKNTAPKKDKHKRYIVREHQAFFYVNFSEYLDTGLFIDHRMMRQLIYQNAHQKNVLNLYAYTCTASVQAALGGAKSVTSVDLSDNYLQWGQENFALNGFDLQSVNQENKLRFDFIASDVFEWLKNHSEQYELIFIDPPTFSNSKKFYGTFDVQRDHAALINRAMNRLTSTGVLFFSNNYTRFELDKSLYERYDIINITHKTIGFDFNLQKPIHQSFEIRHKNGYQNEYQSHEYGGDDENDEYQNHENKNMKNKNKNKTFKKQSNLPIKKANHHLADKADNKNFADKKFDKKRNHKPSDNKGVDNKRLDSKKFHDKKSDYQQSSHPKTSAEQTTNPLANKRVYVNPKLANRDEIAQKLQAKLLQSSNLQTDNQQIDKQQTDNVPNSTRLGLKKPHKADKK